MSEQSWRLPNTTDRTSSPEQLESAWREFSKPIGDLMGWKLGGFDPGVLYYRKGRGNVDLPEDLVAKINEVLREGMNSAAIAAQAKAPA